MYHSKSEKKTGFSLTISLVKNIKTFTEILYVLRGSGQNAFFMLRRCVAPCKNKSYNQKIRCKMLEICYNNNIKPHEQFIY